MSNNAGATALRLHHPKWSVDLGGEVQAFTGRLSIADELEVKAEVVLAAAVGLYRVATLDVPFFDPRDPSSEIVVERLGSRLHVGPTAAVELRLQLMRGVFIGAAGRARLLRKARETLYDRDIPQTENPLILHFNGALSLTAFIPNT